METVTLWLQNHPKIMAAVIIFAVVNIVLKGIVDSLLAVRAEIDKTPDTDDTWFEKFVTFMRLAGLFIAKLASYFAGFKAQQGSVKDQVKKITGTDKGDGK